jgi:hypothetical protein
MHTSHRTDLVDRLLETVTKDPEEDWSLEKELVADKDHLTVYKRTTKLFGDPS